MSKLPRGWEPAAIGDVTSVQLGRQRSPQHHQGKHMRPYLRAANITWNGLDLHDVKEMNFDPVDAAAFALEPGDVLLNEASGSPNEVGKPAIWRGEIPGCCFQNTILRVRTRGPLTEYLYWYFRYAALVGHFGEAGRGVNIRHLGKAGLAAFPIPIAPRAEQERVVAAVEEHSSHLDAAEASLMQAEQRLDRVRASVVRNLFRRPWPTLELQELADPGRPICYGILKPKTTGHRTVPYVEVRSISLGRIDMTMLHRTTEALHREFIRSELRAGDVVIAVRGSYDRAAVVPDELAGANVSRDVARISSNGRLLPEFLAAYLISPDARRYFDQHARGVAVRGVNIGDLRRLPVPVPGHGEQREVITELDRVATDLDAVGATVAGQLRRARSLRRSILASAFAGRLVSQEPSDEPASVLLERIRAERTAVGSERRRRAAS